MRSSPFHTNLAPFVLALASLQCSGNDDPSANTHPTPGAPEPAAQEVPAAVVDPEPEAPGAGDVDLPGEGLGPDLELIPSAEPLGDGDGDVELTSPTPPLTPPALDCGPDGWAAENAGPPGNRVNYVILADGYGAGSVDTTLEQHIQRAFDRRFNHESGEPYGRYRKFVNICVMKVVSESDGIGNGPTAFDGGNGGDRLARVNAQKVNAYLDQNLPEELEVDWRAVVLNQNRWENTGSLLMLWSGAHADAPGAALHEGGHGFHQLADEYCGSATGPRCGPNQPGEDGEEFAEVNSTGDPRGTDGKWDLWLGSVQKGLKLPDQGATGVQGIFVGSRYEDGTQYRPSGNSMMNSLFGDDVNTSFNSVSREQIVFGIWRAVRPIDSTDPPPGDAADAGTLTVNVIDPTVIDIDWSIDGKSVAEHAGGTLNLAAARLASGAHTISARAYDNASEDLVRNRTGECPGSVTGRYCHASGWLNSTQTVEWTVDVP
jgi:IgA peptidase M64